MNEVVAVVFSTGKMGSLDCQPAGWSNDGQARNVFINVVIHVSCWYSITGLWYLLHNFTMRPTNTDRIDSVPGATSSIGRAHA
jgi:hypothetical protein